MESIEKRLDKVPYLTWIKDINGKILYVNEVYIREAKKSKEEIIGCLEEEIWGTFLKTGKLDLENKTLYIDVYEKELYETTELIGYKGIAKIIGKVDKDKNSIRQEVEKFLKNSNQVICFVDEKHDIHFIGKGYKNLLGWEEEEMKILLLNKIVKYKEKVKAYYEEDLEKEPFIVSKRFPCKEGMTKHISWTLNYIEEKDGLIIIGYDATRNKIEEEKYLALQVEMELEYIKGELLACTSNEFKTPVNTILYALQLLQDKVQSEEVQLDDSYDFKKYMELIKQNAYRLIKLINNLVDSNSIDAGEYILHLSNQDIVQIIKEIVESVEDYIDTKGIKIKLTGLTQSVVIACDPEKIERIMLNLISNAIKYGKEDGTIQIDLKCGQQYLYIYVLDDGQGIPKEKIDSIFERFSQVEESLTRKTEGSGIGLSIVKSLVAMHGGQVNVNSLVGKGTEFIVMLPLKVCKEEESGLEQYKGYKRNNKAEIWNIEFADIYG